MFYDHTSISLLTPTGEPTASAKFRREYAEEPKAEEATTAPGEPRLQTDARLLRAQVMGRMVSLFRFS